MQPADSPDFGPRTFKRGEKVLEERATHIKKPIGRLGKSKPK
jgi:hypothetical protein